MYVVVVTAAPAKAQKVVPFYAFLELLISTVATSDLLVDLLGRLPHFKNAKGKRLSNFKAGSLF